VIQNAALIGRRLREGPPHFATKTQQLHLEDH
jgi:hypothetical protein